MKVLLTGAAGRIGAATCRHLHAAGFEVRAADLKPNKDLPVPVEVVDLLRRESCYRVVSGMDAVVHLANHPSFHLGHIPEILFNENVAMNMNLFQAACDRGVRRLVFSSSVQAFTIRHHLSPEPPPGPMLPYLPVDGRAPGRPVNPYGLSKVVSEEMLRYFVSAYGLAAVAIRFPYVVDEVTVRLFREKKIGRIMSAEEAFGYLHVHDAARLIEACLKAELTGYRQYFPVVANAQTLAELPALLEGPYKGVPWRDGTRPAAVVDISEITRETGWVPLSDPMLTPSPP
jgi:nucleoside-diphosphate-sugar epimerase